MEGFQFHTSYDMLDPHTSRALESENGASKIEPSPSEKGEFSNEVERLSLKEAGGDCLADSMVCDSGSRLIPNGFVRDKCNEELVIFVNAGCMASMGPDAGSFFSADTCFQGGDVLRTDECINDGGDYPFLYQSARLGNFCYRFSNFLPGNYFVDLHFAEIINTNGPRGMRVFDVFIQEEKVLSDFDIFSVVGANKPLQLVDSRVSIKENGEIVVRFKGIHGSPVASGICIRKATKESVPPADHDYLVCNNCAAEIEVPSTQKKSMRTKATIKFEKKIEELTIQCKRKADECYEAWMSLNSANEELEKVRMELDNKLFQTYSLDQVVEKQAEKLRSLSSRYQHDKSFWVSAVNDLEEKIKIMKDEQSQLSQEAHECADSVPELNKMVLAVQELVAQCEDLKMKYCEEQAKRKKLYNQVQEAKGNIRVFCRCRPLSEEEISAGHAVVVDFDAAKDGDLGILTGGSSKKLFKFDRVYAPKDNQVEVFADASPMVVSVLDGYNVCIFAYGQTGTGKTFTMEGTEHDRGVNYRTLEELFEVANRRSETYTYNISVSVLEVYNEQIRDLLATSPTSKKLEIKQASEGFHHVPGIVEAKVESIKEAWNVLQAGSNARAVGSNNVNEHSSRSHCMLCIMVRAKNLMNGECTKSKLWLVDLAGSERLAKTDAQGDRLKEAQNINRSLSALGDVISALATRSSHIPYRNSKLTHLLQDSLGGDSKTLMFVQISPSEKDMGETLSSLNFATRVRGIELGPAKRQIDTAELQKVKAMLEKARLESRAKDEAIRKLEECLQNLESKTKGKDQMYKSQQEKIRDLESQLDLKAVSYSQSEKQVLLLSERLRSREECCSGLQDKVKALESKLREREHSGSAALQQKVKELENKLKEREHSFSAALQQKVNDVENKLKDQVQASESHALVLQHKVKELEAKLKEQEHNSVLHQKIKELEDNLRSHETKMSICVESSETLRSTPMEGKLSDRDEVISELEPNILKSSNSTKRPMSHGSIPKGGYDLHRDVRRKQEFSVCETENNCATISIPFSGRRVRQSDPPKSSARGTRAATKPVTVARPSSSQSRRDQGQGVKDRETNKKRIWSR